MEALQDALVVVLVLTNFRLLGSSRFAACVQTMAIQAVVLGALAMAMHAGHQTVRLGLFVAATVAVKGLLLPWLLRRAAREAGVRRELMPILGYTPSILTGAVLLGVSFWLAGPLRSAVPDSGLLLGAALFTMLSGLLLIVARRQALTQVLGYLEMENGVYAFGAAMAIQEPLLVEMGVLLDVLVAVFVMGIAVYHISREFDHIDTDRLSVLKG
jgi:hydrogenase-4 component E